MSLLSLLAAGKASPSPNNIIVSDSFDRANSTSSLGNADTGQTWIQSSGTWGILSNEAYTSAGASNSQAVVDVGSPDQDISVRITVRDSGTCLVARQTDSNNAYILLQPVTGGLAVYKIVGGSYTLIQNLGGTPAAGDVIRFTVLGPWLQVFINGVSFWSTIDTSITTGNRCGIRCDSTVARFDDFLAVQSVFAGGVETSDNDYVYRTFPQSGTLKLLAGSPVDVEYLVVGGGGAGGRSRGGGGGAGGVRTGTLTVSTDLAVTVGAGGIRGAPPNSGQDSVLGSITAIGGGRGNEPGWPAALSGGSGGAGGAGGAGAAGTSGQGYAGGNGSAANAGGSGGGGGGAGGAGADGVVGVRASGGPGVVWPSGGSTEYARGGNGGVDGGVMGGSAPTPALPANSGYGGHGGDGLFGSYGGQALSGAAGVVVIRYPR